MSTFASIVWDRRVLSASSVVLSDPLRWELLHVRLSCGVRDSVEDNWISPLGPIEVRKSEWSMVRYVDAGRVSTAL